MVDILIAVAFSCIFLIAAYAMRKYIVPVLNQELEKMNENILFWEEEEKKIKLKVEKYKRAYFIMGNLKKFPPNEWVALVFELDGLISDETLEFPEEIRKSARVLHDEFYQSISGQRE